MVGHLHPLLHHLVTLSDGAVMLLQTTLDLLVLLDQGAAQTPERCATIRAATPFDAELFADLASLHHVETNQNELAT